MNVPTRWANFSSKASLGRLFRGDAAGRFGLSADLLGLLMRLLDDLGGFAADRLEILVGPVVHVLEVERDRLHRPAGGFFDDARVANDRGHDCGYAFTSLSTGAAGVEDAGGDGGDFVLSGLDVAEPRRSASVQPLAERLGDLARHLCGDAFDERFVGADQREDQDLGVDALEHGGERGLVEAGEVVEVERGQRSDRRLPVADDGSSAMQAAASV